MHADVGKVPWNKYSLAARKRAVEFSTNNHVNNNVDRQCPQRRMRNSIQLIPAHVLYVSQPIDPESPDLLVSAMRHSAVLAY